MFSELDEVSDVLRDNLNLSAEAFRKFDDVYQGDLSKRLKFTNSLKLRMAMRLTYVPEMQAEIQRIAEGAVTAGVMMEINDNAFLKVEENRVAMIFNDWNDQRAGADIISYMNGYKDPRREKMFTTVKMIVYDENFQPQEVDGYAGIRIGIDVTTKDEMVNAYSIPIISSTSPFLWMNAAEITFLRAEGAAIFKFNMGGDAEGFYNTGIRLSFEQWGAADAEVNINDDNSKPATNVDPAGDNTYANTLSTMTIKWQAGASKDEMQERIIIQKWIANWQLGNEAWADYRRTGYPHMIPATGTGNKSGGIVDSSKGARRMPYPLDEYNSNQKNVEEAVAKYLGGPDNMATDLWWAKKK